ncbi:AraC family transcriptional regulator [Nocardioides sp. AE5]|uniref:AraC family transcriptional regulator n=1 Tax=Nocardioides sp. AE5 TaxID=2962573 RepID=UPI002882662E|nr:AraC family transcriptional regulator [Nocardioides sp. AE5]MDT0202937.1 AraC family transcriptional regulator [Nocardioides sp. AE5]
MGPMIRAASLRGFVPLVRELGGDPAALLARFGIDPAALDSDDSLIDLAAHDRMLDGVADELGCPDLGLRLSQRQDLTILGPLAVAIQACSTVAQAIEVASKFLFVHSPGLSVGVEPDPDGVRGVVAVTYRKDLHAPAYPAQAIELGVALVHRISVAMIGQDTGLRSVHLPHQPLSAVQGYVDHFGADVRFGKPFPALRVERRVLDEAFATANEAIRLLALDHLATHYADPGARMATQVERALVESLAVAPPSLPGTARLFSVHPRTLQRRLAAEQTSFEEILDDVRRREAERLLTTTDLPLGQVAGLLAFTEQSTLSHACRRWFAMTPRELRGRATLSS